MKNVCWIMMLLTVFLFSCSGKDREQQAAETGVINEETNNIKSGNELQEPTIAILDNAPIFKFTKSNLPQFNWNSFQLTRFWTEDSLLTTAFEPEPGYFENYGPLLKYSPDSTKFIDLDSYNISISRNNKGERVGEPQGPDVEVSLVDLKKKQTSRLLFLGPGNNVEDATWLDNENLILVTSVDNGDTTPNASVIKYSIPSKTYQVYETADPSIVNNLKGYWRKERLKGVIMR